MTANRSDIDSCDNGNELRGRSVESAAVIPAAITACMNLHFAAIREQMTPGSISAVIRYGAGWRNNRGALEVPGDIAVLPLPSYAPELNAMKNLWDHLRGNRLSFGVRGDHKVLVDT